MKDIMVCKDGGIFTVCSIKGAGRATNSSPWKPNSSFYGTFVDNGT